MAPGDRSRGSEEFLESLCPACTLRVDGRGVEARITRDELQRIYLPLCRLLAERTEQAAGVRALVGVTGPPGSGKSTFCALLQALLAGAGCLGCGRAAVVSLDGFHYPNAYLGAHSRTGPDGSRQVLRTVKGTPETFDLPAFLAALDRLRVELSLELPRYDRATHDPVAAGVRIEARHRLVLVEGNYLLLDGGGWGEVRARLDLTLFLSMPLPAIRPYIIARHVRGGRSPGDAERHFQAVDRPNYELCMAGIDRADLIVERTDDQRVTSMRPGRG